MKVYGKILSLVLIFFVNINCSNEPFNIEALAKESSKSFQEIDNRYKDLEKKLASAEKDILAKQNEYQKLKQSPQEKMDAVQKELAKLKTNEQFYKSELSKISASYQQAKSKNESLQNLLKLYREIEQLKQEIKTAKQSEINKLQNQLASKTMSYKMKMALL